MRIYLTKACRTCPFKEQCTTSSERRALIAINGRIDLKTLAFDDILFPAHQFCKQYSLIAPNTTARMEVVQQVKALADIRLGKHMRIALRDIERLFDEKTS
jgi:hypothetical protein